MNNQINPYVLLCAIMFNVNKRQKVMVRPDDASPEIEIEVSTVGIAEEEGAAICVFPMEQYIKFQSIPYDFSMRVENGHCIIGFEKHQNKTTLYSANGESVVSKSPAIDRLLSKLSGGELGDHSQGK